MKTCKWFYINCVSSQKSFLDLKRAQCKCSLSYADIQLFIEIIGTLGRDLGIMVGGCLCLMLRSMGCSVEYLSRLILLHWLLAFKGWFPQVLGYVTFGIIDGYRCLEKGYCIRYLASLLGDFHVLLRSVFYYILIYFIIYL